MKKVVLVTDGACIGNPGPGGWACILRYQQHKRELFGCEPATTNNRMELLAVIEGLEALKEPCEVAVVTDSEYVKKGITEWLPKWKERGWKKSAKGKSGGQAVRNRDLWEELDKATQAHTIAWEWVRGHAGHKDNSRCDQLALRAAKLQISSRSSEASKLPRAIP